jgi:hypothetical protein
MRRIIAFIAAALSLAACSNPTAPDTRDRSGDEAKAKAALGAAANTGRHASGKLAGN